MNSYVTYGYGRRPSHLLAWKNLKLNLKNKMALRELLQINPAEVDAAVNAHIL